MTRIKLSDTHLSLGDFVSTRLRYGDVFGFFIPLALDEPAIIVGDEGSLNIIPLTGERAFKRFQYDLKDGIEGLVFEPITIAVDVMSRASGSKLELGDIFWAGSLAHIVCTDARSKGGEKVAFEIPLPLDVAGVSSVKFNRWSILMEYGRDEIELWRTSEGGG